jgi:predicted Zn finger-like uncharacterized protein
MINLTCVECGYAFELSETKIPSQKFNVKCPSCKKVFQVTVENGASQDPSSGVWQQFRPEIESLVKTHVENIRNDLLSSFQVPQVPALSALSPSASVDKRALVCESDPVISRQIADGLQHLGYTVQVCSLMSEALNRLEGGFYDVITTEISFSDDPEGGQKISNKVNSRKLDERRRMFLAVISRNIKTLGPDAAFFYGANISIQKSDLDHFESLIHDGIRYFTGIYSNYFEVLTESAERL